MVGQSVSPSWRRVPFGTDAQMFMCCQTITSLFVMGHPPLREDVSASSDPFFLRCHHPEDDKAI